eukprot:GHRQ01031994.1.p1 GENE.GHRQ01031994.1~~GHRQ01031994.1.p1  ORF type:complete len:140 (-),score=24.31 GHRQ01031994.1:155-574(-)
MPQHFTCCYGNQQFFFEGRHGPLQALQPLTACARRWRTPWWHIPWAGLPQCCWSCFPLIVTHDVNPLVSATLPTTFFLGLNSYQAHHHQELYAFSVNDNLVAAGGQGDVHFWDRRTQQRLASFDDMHMDDVTQVRAGLV